VDRAGRVNPGTSTPAPAPFDLVVTSASNNWAGVGVEARSGVDAVGVVLQRLARTRTPSPTWRFLVRLIFGRLCWSVGCAARARRPVSGAARAERAGGLRPVRQGRLEDVQKVLPGLERSEGEEQNVHSAASIEGS